MFCRALQGQLLCFFCLCLTRFSFSFACIASPLTGVASPCCSYYAQIGGPVGAGLNSQAQRAPQPCRPLAHPTEIDRPLAALHHHRPFDASPCPQHTACWYHLYIKMDGCWHLASRKTKT